MEISVASIRKTVEVSPIHQQYMEKLKKDFEFFEQNPIPLKIQPSPLFHLLNL